MNNDQFQYKDTTKDQVLPKTDIVERLDEWCECSKHTPDYVCVQCTAKAEITRLRGALQAQSLDAYAAVNPANWQTNNSDEEKLKHYEKTLNEIANPETYYNVLVETFADLNNEITRLREQLKAFAWQPIETAPKDGTQLILICTKPFSNRTDYFKGKAMVDRWQNKAKNGTTGWQFFVDPYYPPTHWMPLPAPPTDKEAT